MANNLNLYDPLFYAQESLIMLEKALGMAGRVHRGYDKDPQQKGSTIQISRPGVFTAQDAPSVAQDLAPDNVSIKLDQWKEVKFKLTDKELTYTTAKIINDHIRPMAYALADNMDVALCKLAAKVPTFKTSNTPATVQNITDLRAQLFGQRVPLDTPGMVHVMVDGTKESELLANSAFTQWQGAGPEGVASQLRGSIGTRFGLEFFANQNVQTQAAAAAADQAGVLVGSPAKGATTISFNAVTVSFTFKAGTPVTIAGASKAYVLDADAVSDGTGLVTGAVIFPALAEGLTAGAVVTLDGAGHVKNLAFHRNAFAIAMAPLSDIGNELGAKIATVSDPISNLSLRSRLFYVGDASTVYVALDVLYGVQTLDERLAAVWRG